MDKQHVPRVARRRSGIKLLLDVKKDPLAYFTNLMLTEGPFCWLNLTGRLVLVLNDAKGIEHVLQDNPDNYKKAHFVNVLKPLLGDGIFLNEGEDWRKQRHESSPVFATSRFNSMMQPMIDAVEVMMKRWEARIDNNIPIDITVETMGLTLDVLLRALFHEVKESVAADMQTALGIILREAEGRIWSAIKLPQRLVHMLPKYRRAFKFLEDIVAELIEERRNHPAHTEDLLSRLITSYGETPKEQKQLQAQVMSFLLAGHETTSHGLSWAFYNIARHTNVQRTLTEEIDRCMGDQKPTFPIIKKLPYTRQVFDEVLRHYPPVWTMSREAIKRDTIPLEDGSTILLPENATVMLCGYSVHRREKYWPNPEAFDPDRFSVEQSVDRPKFSWFPFGGGQRLCLGIQFAQIESILAVAMVMRRYELTILPGQNVRPLPIITLRPDQPMMFKITRRVHDRVVALDDIQQELGSEVDAAAQGCPYHAMAKNG